MSLSNLLDAPAEQPGFFSNLSSSLGVAAGTDGSSSSSFTAGQQKRPQGSGDSTPTAAAAAAAGGSVFSSEVRVGGAWCWCANSSVWELTRAGCVGACRFAGVSLNVSVLMTVGE